MSSARGFLCNLGLGICTAYFLDPEHGRLRRARLRDRTTRLWRRANEAVDVTRRDVEQRAQGLAARARGYWEREPVSDDVLVERIRAEMGRRVSHPHAIHVSARDGCVTLEGPILAREVQGFVRRVRRIPGVYHVENRLEVHVAAENVPELQGGPAPLRQRNPLQESWPPAARLLAGSAGALVWLLGAPSRRFRGYALGTLGAMLVWRAVANSPARSRFEPLPANGIRSPAGTPDGMASLAHDEN